MKRSLIIALVIVAGIVLHISDTTEAASGKQRGIRSVGNSPSGRGGGSHAEAGQRPKRSAGSEEEEHDGEDDGEDVGEDDGEDDGDETKERARRAAGGRTRPALPEEPVQEH